MFIPFRIVAYGVEIDGQFPVQFTLKRLPKELDDFLMLLCRKQIRLGQQENDIRCMTR